MRLRAPLCAIALAGWLLLELTGTGIAHALSPADEPPDDDRGAGPRHRPPALERILERHADRLGLDAATREQIDAIVTSARAENESLRRDLRARREELRRLLSEEMPDESAVMAQAARIGETETALQQDRLRTMLKIRALLTPAQRAELVRIHEDRKERREERRSRRDWLP